jgi:hypothetical protein
MRFVPWPYPAGNVPPSRERFEQLIAKGWVAQTKIDGWSSEVLIDAEGNVEHWTRHHTRRKQNVAPEVNQALLRQYKPDTGWIALAGEYVAKQKRLYLFDVLVWQSEVLIYRESFEQRFARLKPGLEYEIPVLQIFRTVEECVAIMDHSLPVVEGLVFKSGRPGIDNALLRCRKKGHRHF